MGNAMLCKKRVLEQYGPRASAVEVTYLEFSCDWHCPMKCTRHWFSRCLWYWRTACILKSKRLLATLRAWFARYSPRLPLSLVVLVVVGVCCESCEVDAGVANGGLHASLLLSLAIHLPSSC